MGTPGSYNSADALCTLMGIRPPSAPVTVVPISGASVQSSVGGFGQNDASDAFPSTDPFRQYSPGVPLVRHKSAKCPPTSGLSGQSYHRFGSDSCLTDGIEYCSSVDNR